MDDTTTLPACLADPSILFVGENDWGNMLHLVQKRLDGTGRRSSGWFVVTVLRNGDLWDGPYTQRHALNRFDQQLDYLQAVLGHARALESANPVEPMAQRPAPQWDATQWETGWQCRATTTDRCATGVPGLS